MYCAQCGEQIDDDSRFCRHCGAAQKAAAVPAVADAVAADPEPPAVDVSGQPKPKTALVVGAVVLGLLLLLIIGTSKTSSPATADNSVLMADNLEAAADAMEAAADNATNTVAAAPAEPSSPWTYSTDEDKVRRATTYYASASSTNSITQDFPYEGNTTGTLTVRKAPAYGTDVMVSISSGQLLCRSYDGCSGTVSFDGGAPQHVGFNAASDNSSETIFVVGAKSFIAKLKKAKKVVVEVELYQAGRPQFEFDVQGLKWDR